ncbi:2-hydroxyacid dehydrogenase [Roseomonas sp. CCTCC AB2023176]|uniref:2-hydroxyacid dehydrogenase n=1 Tax=Roseomonas sp. CCTCC AB2023176 TaxID=3342640 RepID=UPI0035DAFA4C
MPDATRERLLLLCPVPADLRAALSGRYDVTEDRADPPRLAVTTSMKGLDAATLDALPALRMVACQGVGLDRIDLPAARARGVAVSHTPDVLTEDVADFAIALMYAVVRRTGEADRFVRAGRWSRERMTPGTRLHGKTCGIVGMGRIGQAIARRAAGIGMVVAWNGPNPKPALPYAYEPDLRRLAEVSDVLILAMPGGPETTGMVDGAVLSALGSRGFLVNIARGSVVDEAALLQALETGGIAGAGLDVFATEPGLDPRFVALENVALAPHYASVTHETRQAMIARMLDDLDAFAKGRPFLNVAA